MRVKACTQPLAKLEKVDSPLFRSQQPLSHKQDKSRGGTNCAATAGRERTRKDVSGGQSPRAFSSSASSGRSLTGSNVRREPCAEEHRRSPSALPGYPDSTPALCIRCQYGCSWEHPHSGHRCRWSGSGGHRSSRSSRSCNFFGNDFSYSHHPFWIGASEKERSPYCMLPGPPASLAPFDRKRGTMVLF